MTRRLFLSLAALGAALLAAAPARAAGPKSGGIYTVTDDLVGGSTGGTASGGAESVTGALGQTAQTRYPLPSMTTAGGFFSFPFPLQKLQILLPGETPDPNAPSGKDGVPDEQVVNSTFPVRVRGVDFFSDQLDYPTDSVRLFTGAGNLGTEPLAAGATIFANLTLPATGPWTLSAIDLSNPLIPTATSALLVVVRPSPGPPAVSLTIAGSTVATAAGALTGVATDGSAVARVTVALQDIRTGKFLSDWTAAGTFSSAMPFYGTATLTNVAATRTPWRLGLSDAQLASGVSYAAYMHALNPTGYYIDTIATFTFDSGLTGFGAFDGQGAASVIPAVSSGCEPARVSLSLNVGAAGVAPGGAVAVRLPDGWQAVTSTASASIADTRPAVSTALALNPPSFNGATLGDGWLLMTVNAGPSFVSGDTVTFSFTASPPLGPKGRGRQLFQVLEQSGPSGRLVPLSSPPALTLNAGTTSYLAFVDASPLALGSPQFSPVMQVRQTDLCGNPTSTTTVQTVYLSAGRYGAGGFTADAGAGFLSAATNQPINTVTLSTGIGLSTTFYYFTTNPNGWLDEVVRASATLPVAFSPGTSLGAETARFAQLLAQPLSLSSISVDTGPLTSGATSAAIVAGDAPGAAFARFKTSAPGVPWTLEVSSDPAAFWPVLARREGTTDASGSGAASWSGQDERALPPAYAPAGAYRLRLTLGGGVVTDVTREIRVAQSALIAGNLGAAGAYALVQAAGPGAGAGRPVLATSTGYFEDRALHPPSSNALSITTIAAAAGGRSVALAATVPGVVASAAGTLIPGTIALPAAAFFRVAAQIPRPAPREAAGEVVARDATGGQVAAGTLHFAAQAASSDDGSQAFGRAASTWTVLALPPGSYELDLSVADLGFSTAVFNAATSTDVVVVEPQSSALFAWAVAPSSSAAAAAVSIEARRAGDAAPSVFSSTVIPASTGVVVTSATFALYGLSAGTWTVVARGPGLSAGTTTLYVDGIQDLGVSTAPYVALALGAGGVVAGTVTVTGDTGGATQCLTEAQCPAGTFELAVQAYSPSTFAQTQAVVRLSTSAASASSTFTLAGLDPGAWVLGASLPGFALAPSSGVSVAVSTSAPASAAVSLARAAATLRLDVRLPVPSGGGCRPASDFSSVGLAWSGGPSPSFAVSDPTAWAGATTTVHCSSATVLAPPLLPGFYSVTAAFAQSGASASGAFSLVAGSTTAGALDLTGSTLAVSGRASFAGLARLRAAGGYAVDVSSIAGALSLAATTGYCLLGSTNALAASALHLELARVDALSGTAPALAGAPSFAPGACRNPDPGAALTAAVAPVAADGTFQFPGVSPGLYALRFSGELDLDPADGPELAGFSTLLLVTAPVSGLAPSLAAGSRVSGRFALPAGAAGSGTLLVSLSGGGSNLSAAAAFSGAAAAYAFDRVPDGQYTLAVLDPASPPRWLAAPVAVRVAGADVTVPDQPLSAAGTIVGRLALEQTLADGTTRFLLLTADDRPAWPLALTAGAARRPWSAGAFFPAAPAADGAPALDSAGRFSISGLPAGVYDVELNASGAPGPGGASAVSAVAPSVTVAEGQTVDLGVIALRSGAQLRGRLLDSATGAPVANARVAARAAAAGVDPSRSRAPEVATLSDAAGYYAVAGLDPLAPRFDVTAGGQAAPGAAAAPYQARTVFGVDARSTATVDFSLLPAAFTVTGRVSVPAGAALQTSYALPAPVPGATLLWQSVADASQGSAPAEAAYYSGLDGSFSIPAATGAYRLTVEADGFAPLRLGVVVSTGSLAVGTLALSPQASLSGAVLRSGDAPASQDDAVAVYAAAPDMSDVVPGSLSFDAASRSVTSYGVPGLKTGKHYRLLFLSAAGELVAPPEASDVVAPTASSALSLDVLYRIPPPTAHARARRVPGGFAVTFDLSQPLRRRLPADDDMTRALSTGAALGSLSGFQLSADRRELTALYAPAVGESSFTLRLSGRSAVVDPQSSDPVDPELAVSATAAFYTGVDGAARVSVSNLVGGRVALDGDPGRVVLPAGALNVDASSSVVVALESSSGYVATSPSASGHRGPSLAALPPSLAAAAAALPPGLTPSGPFYDVLLPAGVRPALIKPAQLTLGYAAGADPSALNVYWYNPAANAYVLQQDVTGAAPRVDPVNRTVTLNVDHFSTYALFPAAAAVITGAVFGGSDIDAFNFPNPFDLNVKTVQKIHGGGASAGSTIRGTMLRFALPEDVSGPASIRIFGVTGQRVRTIDLGELSGGQYYYQEWDGRNDAGLDAASGVYFAEIKVGSRSKFVKMALIK